MSEICLNVIYTWQHRCIHPCGIQPGMDGCNNIRQAMAAVRDKTQYKKAVSQSVVSRCRTCHVCERTQPQKKKKNQTAPRQDVIELQ